MPSFQDLALLPSLVSSLDEQGLTHPTPVQSEAVRPLLAGRSLVAVSQTGSGKTLAYVLPLLHRLKTLELEGSPVSRPSTPRGLVLVPGRELGEQVSKVFKSLTHGTRLRVRTALGGTKKQVARQNVSGMFEVLVATPGRLVQLLDGGELQLGDLRTLVCDEADQLLDPGFIGVVRRVLELAPAPQLALFSATLPPALEPLLPSLFGDAPLRIETAGSSRLVPTLRTWNVQVVDGDRFRALASVLGRGPQPPSLLFANTRDQCERIGAWLDELGLAHAAYRGEMDRLERRANLRRFRAGELGALVCTDLGGRGLDIADLERVVNVHLPRDVDNYLHRAGRTARAGRPGLVVNLVTERDAPLLRELEQRGGR